MKNTIGGIATTTVSGTKLRMLLKKTGAPDDHLSDPEACDRPLAAAMAVLNIRHRRFPTLEP
jgi:hypothetical protein